MRSYNVVTVDGVLVWAAAGPRAHVVCVWRLLTKWRRDIPTEVCRRIGAGSRAFVHAKPSADSSVQPRSSSTPCSVQRLLDRSRSSLASPLCRIEEEQWTITRSKTGKSWTRYPSASLVLIDFPQVDVQGLRYKSVNSGEEKSPGSPNW